MSKFLLFALIASALAGCASAGTQVDPGALTSFKAGQTTYAEVVSRVGTPTAVTTSSTGQRVAVYSYTHSQARPETFIPIVGAFVGGADATSSSVVFKFDSHDVLVDYSTTQSNVGVGMGAASATRTTQ